MVSQYFHVVSSIVDVSIRFAVSSSGLKTWIKTYKLCFPISWLITASAFPFILPIRVIRPTLWTDSVERVQLDIRGMPGYGKSLENGDFNSDLTKALTGSNLHHRERHKMKKWKTWCPQSEGSPPTDQQETWLIFTYFTFWHIVSIPETMSKWVSRIPVEN